MLPQNSTQPTRRYSCDKHELRSQASASAVAILIEHFHKYSRGGDLHLHARAQSSKLDYDSMFEYQQRPDR